MMRRVFPLIFLMLAMAVTAWAAPPVASNFSATVSTVGATLIQLQGSDPDGTALTFAIASGPSHGSLSGLNATNGYVVFIPTAGYVGTDSFTFTVTSGGQTSAAATASITITNAKTRIVDTLVDVSGNPRTGKVTFILTQKVQSPSGLIPVSGSASAVLNGSGQFDISVYPSTALAPQAFYQVKFTATGSFKEELIGVYAIPASTATITLAPYRVTDTNLAAQYVFVDFTAMNSILSVASGAAAVYTGTPADNTLQKHDAVSGKLKNSSIVDNDTTVAIGNKVQMPATKTFSWDATGGISAPSQSDIYQGARNIFYPGAGPNQITNGVESGYFWHTSPAYKFYFNAGADGVATWTSSGLTLPGTVTATSFAGSGSSLTGINFSQLSGSATDAQVPNTITLDSLSQITTRSASDLSSGTLPDARFPATLPVVSGVNLTNLNASNLASGTLPDARFPATLPVLSGVNLTNLNGSNIASGTVAPARLGSGGAGLGTKLLADNSTFVLPESLGLVDIVSSSDGAYPIIANSHTLTPGYLKQDANGVTLDGTASGPYFRINSNGLMGSANYTGAELYTETSLVRLGGRRGGTFASQDMYVQFNALGNGTTQIMRNGTVNWIFEGDTLHPAPTTQGIIGQANTPITSINMKASEEDGIFFWNSGVLQGFLGSEGLNTLSLYDDSAGQTARFNYGPSVYLQAGSGSPEGSVTAGKGSIYSRTSDGHVWRKDSGSGNTGWVDMSVGGTNPTDGYIPYNNAGVFADSILRRVDAHTLQIEDTTPTTGSTTFIIKEGVGQSGVSGHTLKILTPSGGNRLSLDAVGGNLQIGASGSGAVTVGADVGSNSASALLPIGLDFNAAATINWRPSAYAGYDSQIKRAAPGVFGLINPATTFGGTFSTPATTPSQFTSDQNDYAMPAGSGWLRVSTSTDLSLTGIAAGVDGQRLVITNVGSNLLYIVHQSTSSSAVNRFLNQGSADIPLNPHDSVNLIYDANTSRWRVSQ